MTLADQYNANTSNGREASRRLLDAHGLAVGDLVYVEEENSRERRGWVGCVLHAYVDRRGNVQVTLSGRSSWAPGSGPAVLAGPGNSFGARIVRKLLAVPAKPVLRVDSPINWRVAK